MPKFMMNIRITKRLRLSLGSSLLHHALLPLLLLLLLLPTRL